MKDDIIISFRPEHAPVLEEAAEYLRGSEATPEPGSKRLDAATIAELVGLRSLARGAAETFSEAIKAQSEACGLSRSALRRYVCALEADKLQKLDAEAEDLARLMTRESSD